MPTIRHPLIVQFLRVGVVSALATVAVAAIVVVEFPGDRASAQAGSLPAMREPVAACGTGNVLTGRTQKVVAVLTEKIIENNVFGAIVNDCTDVIPFHMNRVRGTIDLSNKGLREIRSGDFAGLGLPSVNNAQIIVDLRGNELTTLPSDAFQGLGQVHTIHLSDNAITSLPSDAFNDVKDTVTDLRLNGNELTTLPSGTLSGWSGLLQVLLNGNAITSLPANTFDGNTSMTNLNLNDNFLKSDGLGFLTHTGFTSLTNLDMNDNLLTHDGSGPNVDLQAGASGVFRNHTSLSILSLRSNRFKTLPSNAFMGLGSLTILRLQDNLLSDLPSGAFTGLTSVFALGLDHNVLGQSASFDPMVFNPMASTLSSSATLGLWIRNNGLSATQLTALNTYATTNTFNVLTADTPVQGYTPPPTYPTRSAPGTVANPAASTCGAGNPLQGRSQWLVTKIVADLTSRATCADVTAADLAGITTLSVTSGRIPGFTANDFAGMTRLRSLTLGGTADTTAILSLPTGLFSANTELRVLKLPYNYLTAWPTSALSGLTNLRELDLSYNQIPSIPAGALASFTKLRVLNLRGNQIATVPDAVFQGASSLRQLWMDGNPWTGLSIGHFAYRSLTSLRDLRVGTTLARASAADQANLESVLPAIGVGYWPAAVVTEPPPTPTPTPTPTATPDPDAPTDPDATATSTPTRDERIELAIVSRIAPTVRTLSVTAGDRIRLEFSVWDIQDGRDDDLIQERNVPISWSDDDGAGTFTEFGGSTTNGNGDPDDRVVIYTAPSLPGRYVVTAAFVQSWRCDGSATDCAATFTVSVQRAAVAATPVAPCPPTGQVADTIADADGAQYAAVTPAEGGRFDGGDGSGIYLTVPAGALPDCEVIGIRMYSLGPSSAYMSGVRTVLAGDTYRVAAVNRSTGQPLDGFQMSQPARVCVPLPDMFRQNLTGVNMVRHIGDVASPLTSAIVSDDVNGLSVCGNVSLLPSDVTVAGPASAAVPTPAPTPSVDSELPEAGATAPSYAYILLALLIGMLLLTGISRIRRMIKM